MMLAYKKTDLQALADWQLAKALKKDGMLAEEADLTELETASTLYNPGILMRVLLFVVGIVGLSGVVGMAFFMFQNALEDSWQGLLIFLGVGLLVAHEAVFVQSLKHFKTGLTDVVLFGGLLMLSVGINGDNDRNMWITFLIMAVVCTVAAIRYVNNVLVLAALALVVAALLQMSTLLGPTFTNLLPFIIMGLGASFFAFGRSLEKKPLLEIWENQINTLQAASLVLFYAGGNYYIVRELGQDLNGTYLEPGTDIPFAWIFYAFTAVVPLVYLFLGIKWRSRIFIWVGLAAAGFSVVTFKYYFSLGHPEISITLSGMLLLGVSIYFLNYLKSPKKGITRDRLVAANLDFLTAEGVFISQTISTAAQPHEQELFNGGGFGGGGASGNF